MRIISLLFILLTGCNESGETDACALFASNEGCPECADGEVTCSYGDASVTLFSCGGCQAEFGLYYELCEAGITDSAETIQTDMVCEDTVSE